MVTSKIADKTDDIQLYKDRKASKTDILSHFVMRDDCKDIKRLLVHYRYSELPSPTNEVNLVKSERKSKCFYWLIM